MTKKIEATNSTMASATSLMKALLLIFPSATLAPKTAVKRSATNKAARPLAISDLVPRSLPFGIMGKL